MLSLHAPDVTGVPSAASLRSRQSPASRPTQARTVPATQIDRSQVVTENPPWLIASLMIALLVFAGMSSVELTNRNEEVAGNVSQTDGKGTGHEGTICSTAGTASAHKIIVVSTK